MLRLPSILLLAALLAPPQTRAQVVERATKSAGEGSGPLSELSTNVGNGSRPVSEGSLTVGEGSAGSMISGPMRDPRPPSMISGPVSEISRGPVTSFAPVTSNVSVREGSVGAVTQEAQRPVGEPLLEPQQDLAALQEQLRLLRRQAEEEDALHEDLGTPSDTVAEAPAADDTGTALNEEGGAPPPVEGSEADEGRSADDEEP